MVRIIAKWVIDHRHNYHDLRHDDHHLKINDRFQKPDIQNQPQKQVQVLLGHLGICEENSFKGISLVHIYMDP